METPFNFRRYTYQEQMILATLYEKPTAYSIWEIFDRVCYNMIANNIKNYTQTKFRDEILSAGRIEKLVQKYRSFEMPIPSYGGIASILIYLEKEGLIAHRVGKDKKKLYYLTPYAEKNLKEVFTKKNGN